jgi:hypothetical protein
METLAMSADSEMAPYDKDRDKADDFKGVYFIDVLSKSMGVRAHVRISMKDDAQSSIIGKSLPHV